MSRGVVQKLYSKHISAYFNGVIAFIIRQLEVCCCESLVASVIEHIEGGEPVNHGRIVLVLAHRTV